MGQKHVGVGGTLGQRGPLRMNWGHVWDGNPLGAKQLLEVEGID